MLNLLVEMAGINQKEQEVAPAALQTVGNTFPQEEATLIRGQDKEGKQIAKRNKFSVWDYSDSTRIPYSRGKRRRETKFENGRFGCSLPQPEVKKGTIQRSHLSTFPSSAPTPQIEMGWSGTAAARRSGRPKSTKFYP